MVTEGAALEGLADVVTGLGGALVALADVAALDVVAVAVGLLEAPPLAVMTGPFDDGACDVAACVAGAAVVCTTVLRTTAVVV